MTVITYVNSYTQLIISANYFSGNYDNHNIVLHYDLTPAVFADFWQLF